MYVLIVTAGVDWLLPSVQIPAFAWILIVLLWVCRGAVKEAKKHSAPAPKQAAQPSNSWLMSKDMPGVYSTVDQAWAITVTPHQDEPDVYILWGETEDENIRLSAKNIGEAMDKADKIIAVVED